jgi:Ca2+-binding RTX toxin-like protein
MTNIASFPNSAAAVNSLPSQENDFLKQVAQAQKTISAGTPEDDFTSGGSNTDLMQGGGGNDTIIGNGGDDYLFGEAGNDVIYGDDGHDTLGGGVGNDIIEGGYGKDTIESGNGDDTINAGPGTDFISAGEGSDKILDTLFLSDGDTFGIDGGETRDENGTEHKDTLDLNIQGAGNTVFVAEKNGTEYNLVGRGGNYNNQVIGRFSGIEEVRVNGERVAIPQR